MSAQPFICSIVWMGGVCFVQPLCCIAWDQSSPPCIQTRERGAADSDHAPTEPSSCNQGVIALSSKEKGCGTTVRRALETDTDIKAVVDRNTRSRVNERMKEGAPEGAELNVKEGPLSSSLLFDPFCQWGLSYMMSITVLPPPVRYTRLD